MTCNVCFGRNQGRNCPACLNATRAAVGLHRIDSLELARRQGFLRTEDGGHRVHGEDSLRIPAPTESSSASVGFLVVAISSIAAAAIGVFLCVLKSSCI